MLESSRFRIDERIYEGQESLVVRGCDLVLDLPVILKILNRSFPSASEVSRFRDEFFQIFHLNFEGVPQALSFEQNSNTFAMVFRDRGGCCLATWIKKARFRLAEVLEIGIAAAATLARLHHHGLVHQKINLAHLIWNPESRYLELIDFDPNPHFFGATDHTHIRSLMEKLAFLAPEQTGQGDASVDERSDLYSLGAVLYRLLAERDPVIGGDPAALVHAILAQVPEPVSKFCLQAPPALVKILAKLLEKEPERRYQSAFGLRKDLERLQELLAAGHESVDFSPGTQDHSSQLRFAKRLYGRESQRVELLRRLDEIAEGQGGICLIQGTAGSGKSSLVQSLRQPVSQMRGMLLEGKYDQLGHYTFYQPLIEAFRSGLRRIQTESEELVALRRARFEQVLGASASVLAPLMPELEWLLGRLEPAGESGPLETRNRIKMGFHNLARAFAEPGRPLVIFLDDLQWADFASLELLQFLGAENPLPGCWLIFSYRDNEVGLGHPLELTLREMAQRGARLQRVQVEALDQLEVQRLIGDTFSRQPEEVAAIAALSVEKTRGNPFFLRQFLQHLHDIRLIAPDPISGIWEWDLERIQRQNLTDNVVELMLDKIQKLPEATRRVVTLAACIGNSFDLQALAQVQQKPVAATEADLREAIHLGLIQEVELRRLEPQHEQGAAGRGEVDRENLQAVERKFAFAHDRIQQAAYALLDEDERIRVHLEIGRIQWDAHGGQRLDKAFFEIVEHLNHGQNRLKGEGERLWLAKLNLRAGVEAKRTGVFEAAARYLETALVLGGGLAGSWPEGFCEIAIQAADAAYYRGDFEKMAACLEAFLAQVAEPVERVRAYEIRIRHAIGANQAKLALELGLEALALLGIQHKTFPGKGRLLLEFLQTQLALRGRSLLELRELPQMIDPKILARMRLYDLLTPTTFSYSPNLTATFTMQMVQLSLRYGQSPETCVAFCNYALLLVSLDRGLDEIRDYGDLALDLANHPQARHKRAKVLHCCSFFLWTNFKSFKEIVEPAKEIQKLALEAGDFEFTAHGIFDQIFARIWSGVNFLDLENEMARLFQSLAPLKQELVENWVRVFYQYYLNMLDQAPEPTLLNGEVYQEANLRLFQERGDISGEMLHYTFKLTACIVMDEMNQALKLAAEIQPVLEKSYRTHFSDENLVTIQVVRLYDHIRQQTKMNRAEKSALKHVIRRAEMRYTRAAERYAAPYFVLMGMYQWYRGQHAEARSWFDRTMIAAGKAGAIQYLFKSAQWNAEIQLGLNHEEQARFYLGQALEGAQRGGYLAKVRQLRNRYPELLEQGEASLASLTGENRPLELARAIDVMTLVKATQAMSREIVRERLVQKMLEIMMENAAAERGLLLLTKGKSWFLESEARIGASQGVQAIQTQSRHESLDGGYLSKTLPRSALQYVSRAFEAVVSVNPESDPLFEADPYIVLNRPKTFLCLPFMVKGQLIGMLYFENRQTSSHFSAARIELLKVLSSQAAISLENAELYADLESYSRDLEHKVELRTIELRERNEDLAFKNRELETLDNIVKSINREMELEPILRTMLTHMAELFPQSTRSAFLLRANSDSPFFLAASLGFFPSALDGRMEEARLRTWLRAHSLQAGDGLFLFDQEGEDGWENGPLPFPIRSGLAMTVAVSQQWMGVLVLANSSKSKVFSLLDLERLERFREHATAAIVKARVLGELREKNETIIKTRSQLIMQEKMASLGTLTAGVAHELKNPLNFVTNFAAISIEIHDELGDSLESWKSRVPEEIYAEMTEALDDLQNNAHKIQEYGKRADNIVHNMFLLSQVGKSYRSMMNLNQLLRESAELAHHGFRGKSVSAVIRFVHDLDPSVGEVEMFPQNLGRAFVNIINNACEAIESRFLVAGGADYDPQIDLITKNYGDKVEIRIRDNGMGIEPELIPQIFTPFFTTKPTGGMNLGLGLSIAYEIITQGHDGEITLISEERQFTEVRMIMNKLLKEVLVKEESL